MNTTRRNINYYIASGALELTPNALGSVARVQVNVQESAAVILYIPGVVDFGTDGWYERWTINAYNTKLRDAGSEYHIYLRLDQGGHQALLVFGSNRYRLDGTVLPDGLYDKYNFKATEEQLENMTDAQKEAQQTEDEYELSEESAYLYLRIGKTHVENGSRVIELDLGRLDTPAGRENCYLRKDIEDTAHELIHFERGVKVRGKSAYGFMEVAQLDAEGNPIVVDGVPSTVEYDGVVIADDGTVTSGNYAEGALGAGYKLGRYGDGMDSYLEIDRLMVRKIAYFVELMIEKLSHVGGQIILTAASMVCSRVEERADAYRCYFAQDDGDKSITNDFVVGDLARCQSFNINAGTSHNVSNSYYWRKVTAVGTDWIDLSKTDCDTGSTVPAMGDNIVLLGHKKQTDESESDAKARQKAIILSSYDNGAPYIAKYTDISSYSLTGCEVSFDGFVDGEQTLRQYGSFFFGDQGSNPANYIKFVRSGMDAGLIIQASKIQFKTTNKDGEQEYIDVESLLSDMDLFQNKLKESLTDKDKAAENYPAMKIIYDSLNELGEWSDKDGKYNDVSKKKVRGFFFNDPGSSFLGNAGVEMKHVLKDGVKDTPENQADEKNWVYTEVTEDDGTVSKVWKYYIASLTGSGFVSTDNYAEMFSQMTLPNGKTVKATMDTSVGYRYKKDKDGNILYDDNGAPQYETDDDGNPIIESKARIYGNNIYFEADEDMNLKACGRITMNAKNIYFTIDVNGNKVTKTLADLITVGAGGHGAGVAGGASGTIYDVEGVMLKWVDGVLVKLENE